MISIASGPADAAREQPNVHLMSIHSLYGLSILQGVSDGINTHKRTTSLYEFVFY